MTSKSKAANAVSGSTLAERLARCRADALKPPPSMTLVEWADTFRVLSREASSTGGKWETARVPIARGPMLAATEPGVHVLTVMACTQLTKTELILNLTGYFMHLDPSPILAVYPTEGSAETWSKDRLATMLRDSPALRGLVDDRARNSGNSIFHKQFPGGQISIVGANSPTELAQRPVRIVLADEVDKYPASAGAEGDPLSLAEERAATFPTSYLFVRVCSPTVKGASRIEKSWLESDQRRAFAPCPHCGHEQVLTWKHVQWSKTEDGEHKPETAALYCEDCGAAWSEPQRLDAMPRVVWRQTRPFKCCGRDQDPQVTRAWRWDASAEVGRAVCLDCGQDAVPNLHAGFHISKLYSPWEPLSKLVGKFLLARKDPERLKTFVNTQLAETFEEARSEAVAEEALLARREVYPSELPQGVALLTAGVDVQDNRLECEVVGWGQDEESWGIEYKIFPGDPSQPDVWEELDAFLSRRFVRADGLSFSVSATAVDVQGHNSQAAYAFARARSGRRVWAVRGKAEANGRRSPVWPKKPTLKTKGRVPLYEVGTQSAKDVIFRRLAILEPGPGYTHFPAEYDAEYFSQLTAERQVPKVVQGNRLFVWENRAGRRNEALDCRVYAYASLCGLQAAGLRLNKHVEANGASVAPRPDQSDVAPPEAKAPLSVAASVKVDPVAALRPAPAAAIVKKHEAATKPRQRSPRSGGDWLGGRGRW